MENRINIAELLKDCPKGMELDCTMFENLYFDYILKPEDLILCYTEYDNIRTSVTFNKYGAYSGIRQAKCVIFPKGKDTWEGFQIPAKDGDVVVCEGQKKITQMFVVQSEHREGRGECYFGYNFENNSFFEKGIWEWDRLATEKERQKLFDEIRAKGCRWNAETKTLERLVKPYFKVGDVVQSADSYKVKIIGIRMEDECYEYESVIAKGIGAIPFNEQDEWELVPDKFDINTLKIFESKVLVRSGKHENWRPAMFGGIEIESHDPYVTVGGSYFKYLIPYEGNEHLTLSKNDCDDFYKTWE